MSNIVPAMQGIVSDIPNISLPKESRGERIARERAEAEAAKKQAKLMKGQPVTKAKVSMAGADQTITVVPDNQQKTVIDLPAMWSRIKKQWNKHRGLNITLSLFVLGLVLLVSVLTVNNAWEQGKIQDQARHQAQTHQGSKAVTPITIVETPANDDIIQTTPKTEKAKETIKVPGVPVTPTPDTTTAPPQPTNPDTQPTETTEALKQVPIDTYIITSGDTLWEIAEDLYGDGTRWKEIYEKNKSALIHADSRNATDAGHWIHAGIALDL